MVSPKRDGPVRLMTAVEVASWLRVSEKTVRRYVLHRGLPFHSKMGLSYRFTSEQIEHWLLLRRGQ